MKKATYLLVLTLSVLILSACNSYDNEPRCVSEHIEIRHKEAWTQFIWSGKVMIPIIHPARDVEVKVCDKWE